MISGGCTTHSRFVWEDPSRLGADKIHGVTLEKGTLYSYTSLPGDQGIRAKAYIPGQKASEISFFHSPNHIQESQAYLEQACCEAGQFNSVKGALSHTQNWVFNLFNTDQAIKTEIALVPNEYGYQYATSYPAKSETWRVRFGFRYDPNQASISTAKTAETLGHELSHIFSMAKGRSRANPLSDEVTASLVGICAGSRVDFSITENPISILPDEASMERFRTSDYADSIHALRDNDRVVIAGMIVTLALERIATQADASGQNYANLLLRYCEKIVVENHDFETSLGL